MCLVEYSTLTSDSNPSVRRMLNSVCFHVLACIVYDSNVSILMAFLHAYSAINNTNKYRYVCECIQYDKQRAQNKIK